MTDIVVTAAQVSLPFPTKADVRTYIAAETITRGQVVYLTTAGKAGVADANAAGKQQSRGIALGPAGAGQAVDVLHAGEVAGFAISALDVGALVYLSDTAGKLADAAGTMTVPVGRVNALSDGAATKILRIFTSWDADWA